MDKVEALLLLVFSVLIVIVILFTSGTFSSNIATKKVATETLEQINQTQILLHQDLSRNLQNKHEDDARYNQSHLILNQVKTIILDHHKDLQSYIDRQNNTTRKIIDEINENQKQNHDIIVNQNSIQQLMKNLTLDNNAMLKKFGNENNAFARAILKQLGLNESKILEDYYKLHPERK